MANIDVAVSSTRAVWRTWTDPRPSPRAYFVQTQKLPEGVWLATCDELPGLSVEADSQPALLAEVREVLPCLLADGERYHIEFVPPHWRNAVRGL